MKPLILSIESGTDVGSVALSRGDKLLSLRENSEERQHAQNLAVYVEEILRDNNLSVRDLDAVAVSKGPGSYTGLRIAVSLAKGICYGAGKPLIAVSGLEAMANVAIEDFRAGIIDLDNIENTLLLPMIDARRMEVYCQLFDSKTNAIGQVEAHIITENSFLDQRTGGGKLLVFGNGAQKCRDLFYEENVVFADIVPSARGVVKPALRAFESGDFENVAYFEPFYLKNFVVTASLKKFF